ncbi:steroid dehydrogenase, putative [Pediculus humanus corporis]|uniref:Steroid dehydrogenase, putative n=1 Tax=Pediculus humanus subsp. corporis TaxID=121224 RepID=E0V951_PEDHC|nr:steroid dehydrogenase, putative [Pediculus humanus corporis]EEB09907.1 steroid dehydrogenase, putative [Pediculus humanus corporis]
MMNFFNVSAYVGAFFVAWFILDLLIKIIQGIRAHFMSEMIPLSVKFGTWAVVTGSTDGIGKAYALGLAKRGINIVLISRNEKKLTDLSQEIMHRHLVTVKTITADFSKGEIIFDKIKKELEDIPVGMLINNVGKQYTRPMYVGDVNDRELWDIININIATTVMMTKMILPKMVERKKGGIVNISSGSEHQPLPFMTVYAASKAFIKSFSDALRFEYRKYGITVQHLSPMFVNTKMNDFSHRLRQTGIFIPDAETYANNAINLLGILNNSSGYWAHGLQSYLTKIPPIWIRTYIGAIMNQVFMNDYYNNNNSNNNTNGNNKITSDSMDRVKEIKKN